MNAFTLNGYDGNGIQLEIDEFLDFPNEIDIHGGYAFRGTLSIVSDGYMVKKQTVYSATGVLYGFSDALQRCYHTLQGCAEYRLMYEDGFAFTVSMETGGKAVIKGHFQSRPDVGNVLQFEMATDQTYFPSVISHINGLQRTYGGMQGFAQ